jgi:hypothetical protein
MMLKCPTCNGTGEFEEEAPGVHLSYMERRVWDIVRKSKHGIEGPALINRAYADRIDGGPASARISIYCTIKAANKKLAAVGQKIGCPTRNRGSKYTIQYFTPPPVRPDERADTDRGYG